MLSKHLLEPDPVTSLFLIRVYYNHDHSESGLQFVKTYYSIDRRDERQNPKDRVLGSFNAIVHLGRMCQNLARDGKLWYAIVCNNHKKDADGRPLVLTTWEPDPKPQKKFTSPPPQFQPALVGYQKY
jgi:hypothetical protein